MSFDSQSKPLLQDRLDFERIDSWYRSDESSTVCGADRSDEPVEVRPLFTTIDPARERLFS